jgi:large subunit ribosomal protein L15
MTMNLHTMSNVEGARRRRKRVGCGESSGHGKTSGRGTKGQYARSGHKHKPAFEGGQMRFIRRIPKRGFTHVDKVVFSPVNVGELARFAAGTEITAVVLLESGILRNLNSPVKILGQGALDKALTVKARAFSASAKAKIEAAGGSCVVVET